MLVSQDSMPVTHSASRCDGGNVVVVVVVVVVVGVVVDVLGAAVVAVGTVVVVSDVKVPSVGQFESVAVTATRPTSKIGTKAIADSWSREVLSQRVKIKLPTMRNKAITISPALPPVVGNSQISALNMKFPPPIIFKTYH